MASPLHDEQSAVGRRPPGPSSSAHRAGPLSGSGALCLPAIMLFGKQLLPQALIVGFRHHPRLEHLLKMDEVLARLKGQPSP